MRNKKSQSELYSQAIIDLSSHYCSAAPRCRLLKRCAAMEDRAKAAEKRVTELEPLTREPESASDAVMQVAR